MKLLGVKTSGPVSGNPWGLSGCHLMTLRTLRTLGSFKPASDALGVGVATLHSHTKDARKLMGGVSLYQALCTLAVHDATAGAACSR